MYWLVIFGVFFNRLISSQRCTDYKQVSNDGQDEVEFDTAFYSNITSYPFDVPADLYTGFLMTQQIDCDPNLDCVIQCNNQIACFGTSITVSNANNKSILLYCGDLNSCAFGKLTVQTSQDLDINVVCVGEYSCQGLTIDIDDTSLTDFNLYCLNDRACGDANLDLDIIDGVGEDSGHIHCVEFESCNDLSINTNSIDTQLRMYAHSEDIKINNGYGGEVGTNLICNQDRFIKIETEFDQTTEYLSFQVENEYDEEELPCKDVSYSCGGKSCKMVYEYSILDDLDTNTQCFWVHVTEVQQAYCSGECATSPTLSPTAAPSVAPSTAPSINPSLSPSSAPTPAPTNIPTSSPTKRPTKAPTTRTPTKNPTRRPTPNPTPPPTRNPTKRPTPSPTVCTKGRLGDFCTSNNDCCSAYECCSNGFEGEGRMCKTFGPTPCP